MRAQPVRVKARGARPYAAGGYSWVTRTSLCGTNRAPATHEGLLTRVILGEHRVRADDDTHRAVRGEARSRLVVQTPSCSHRRQPSVNRSVEPSGFPR